MKTNDPTEAASAAPDNNNNNSAAAETIGKGKPVPNAKPRPDNADADDTYIYKDYAQTPIESLDTSTCHKKVPPQCLQAQKLPSKMALMLADPDLMSVISWLPHGRSWKIYNRDLFTEIALPRYFGHKNYASFVRIVNAWGFRRVTTGLDRDSYYHELFLRGKPELHQRMKRLPTTHRKTPISKEDKAPDFYELSKISPLPDLAISKPPAVYNPAPPLGSGYIQASVTQAVIASSTDKKQSDTAAMLEENMRLSNELLRRQLLELEQRGIGQNAGSPPLLQPGLPSNPAEAQIRVNHQLMQLQRERFLQAQQEQDQLQRDNALKTMNDIQPAELTSAKGDEDPGTNDDDKSGGKMSESVKDLIARYNADKK